jgi:hypothetical protein
MREGPTISDGEAQVLGNPPVKGLCCRQRWRVAEPNAHADAARRKPPGAGSLREIATALHYFTTNARNRSLGRS